MSRYARSQVSGPAIGMAVTAGICVVMLLVALLFDLALLAGALGQLPGVNRPQLVIRIIWGAVMLAVNALILLGAVRMKQLEGRSLALTACVLSVIPCIGPCFVLGIPFGIWGLVVLNEERVRRSFD